MEKHHVISSLQLAMALAFSVLLPSFFIFPSALVVVSGREAIISLFLDFLIAGAGLTIAWHYFRFFPSSTLPEAGEQLLGKWGGSLIALSLLLLELVLGATVLSDVQTMVGRLFLPNTPPEIVILSLLATIAYAVWFDLPTLTRAFQVISLDVTLALLPFLLLSTKDLTHLNDILPPPDLHLSTILAGAYYNFYIFLGGVFIYWAAPWLRWEKTFKICYSLVGGLVATFLVIFSLYVITVGTLGISTIRLFLYPVDAVLRFYFTPSFVIPRPGLLVFLGITFMACNFLSLRLWGAAQAANRLFGTGNFRYYLPFICLILFVTAHTLPSPEYDPHRLYEFSGAFSLLLLYLLPTSLSILAHRRGYKDQLSGQEKVDQPLRE